MSLYLAIALGITIGEIGKLVINEAERLIWNLRHRNRKSTLHSLLEAYDRTIDKEEPAVE